MVRERARRLSLLVEGVVASRRRSSVAMILGVRPEEQESTDG